MKTIHKYRCPLTDSVTLLMPIGAQVLTVQIQNGEPHIIVGTGNPADDLGRYIGTVQEPVFVWHIFEVEASDEIK